MICACCHPFLCILMKQPPPRHLSLLFAPIFVSEPRRGAVARKRGHGGRPLCPRGPTRSVCATNIIHCSGGALIRVKSCLRFPPLRRKLFRPTPRAPADYTTCWMLTFHQTACLRDLICMHLQVLRIYCTVCFRCTDNRV
jgi:hypothetical protein